MTPEELEALVLTATDPEELRQGFAGLDEKQRAKLSSPAQKLYKQLYESKPNQSASYTLQQLLAGRAGDRWKHWNARETRNARLALFAVGPLSTVKKRDLFIWGEDLPALKLIIGDRRPEWLNDWIAHELEAEAPRLDFALLRGWIRDGICSKPAVDGYYRLYAAYLMRTGHYHRGEVVPPLSAQLLADPDLLNDVEGLFRVENIAFNTNSWLTKGAAKDYETWADALVKLSATGHLDRDRLLNLALDGLTRDLKQNQLAGFHAFYKRMGPTPAELQAHQQQFIALLCHPVGHVVKFAIEMLVEIEKRGALDTDPVIREVQVVFAGGGKGNATATLKLLKRIIARTKAREPTALDAVCEALRNGNADVQSEALAILETNRNALNEAQLAAIRGAESFVAASNRARLATLVGSPAASASEPTVLKSAEPAPNDQPYRVISDNINVQQILFDDDALAPIASIDELIEAMLHAVEVVDSPYEIERIIDGISRFAGDRSFDFDQRVAPLLHRVKNGRTGSNGMVIGLAGVGLPLVDLVYTWLTGQLYRTPPRHSQYFTAEDAFVPVAAHLREIADRVARRQPRQLLCTPTHKGGWIDPLVWVDRLKELHHLPDVAQSMDLRLSLLRLAPDNRRAALEQIPTMAPPVGRIARFALGGHEHPTRADRPQYAAWISAARCREPLEDWSDEFAAMELADEWPDSLRPAHYSWRASQHKQEVRNYTWKTPELVINVAVGGSDAADERTGGLVSRLTRLIGGRLATEWEAMPAAALTRRTDGKRYWSGDLQTAWVTQWLAYVWPQNPAAALLKGVAKLVERVDENSSNWTPGHGFFHAMFQKNRPWREAGHLLLALGLAGKDADAKGLAVDALIEGIDGRRFDPALFAATVGQLSEGEWIKYNRLGDALMQVVRVSDRHAAVVGDALRASLPNLDLSQRNAFHVLEVLVEAQATAPQPLAEKERAALGTLQGNSKGAKLARQLLAGSPTGAPRTVTLLLV